VSCGFSLLLCGTLCAGAGGVNRDSAGFLSEKVGFLNKDFVLRHFVATFAKRDPAWLCQGPFATRGG
jgi:hypothetical protein